MRNLITFFSLALILLGAKPADAQSTNSDWHVPAPIPYNNSDWKVPPPMATKNIPSFSVKNFQKLLAVLPPIPPIEPLSIPADLTKPTEVEGENSNRSANRPKPQITNCCCCCPPVVTRRPVKLKPKRKISPGSAVRKHSISQPKPIKRQTGIKPALKPKAVKHRPVKRSLVRYIKYCPCTVDTSSAVNNQPKNNGEKP